MKDRELEILKRPKSFFSESIRNIRTYLTVSSMKTILNTSAEIGDGKSFVTANLAVAFAQDDKKVLVIDANFRKGRQHEIFHVENVITGGYSNLISNYDDKIDFEHYICETKVPGLDILPTGPLPENPVELLESKDNQKLLQKLKKRYDVILLDCPPVLDFSDAVVLAPIVDARVVTVFEKKTKMENVEKVKKLFDQLGLKIDGIILNHATTSGNNYYGYYYTDAKN